MSENPYLVPRPGMLHVTLRVETATGGTTFFRYIDPLGYDYENRLACSLALEALSHHRIVGRTVVWDEPRNMLTELADEHPDFAWATVTIGGDTVFDGPASQCLADLEYARDHPDVDRHVNTRVLVVGTGP